MNEAILSRRELFGMMLGGLAVLANCSTPEDSSPYMVGNGVVSLGAEQDLSLARYRLDSDPDTKIPYVKDRFGNNTYYLSGETPNTFPASYAFQERRPFGFQPVAIDLAGALIPVVAPKQSEFNYSHYRALSTIIRPTDSLDHLLGFTHDERWGSINGWPTPVGATWSIGLVESQDRGMTWQNRGTILTGQDTVEPMGIDEPTGVGQPSALVVQADGHRYVHLYYFEITAGKKMAKKADQIYLARAELSPDGQLGPFLYKTVDGFISKANQLDSVGVITPPRNIPDSVFAALPDIKYNRFYGRYQALFEVNHGLCLAFSRDAINWGEPKLIFRYPTPIIDVRTKVGGLWYSNPTMISPDEEDGFVNKTGDLYLSKGDWGRSPHQMIRLRFTFA